MTTVPRRGSAVSHPKQFVLDLYKIVLKHVPNTSVFPGNPLPMHHIRLSSTEWTLDPFQRDHPKAIKLIVYPPAYRNKWRQVKERLIKKAG
jgi:hypothetical protein